MNKGQLIIKFVKSEGKVHNLQRKVKELESQLKIINGQLDSYSIDNKKEMLLAYEKSQCPNTWFVSKNEADCRINEFLVTNKI
jgi:hypothetical protein